MKLIIDGYNLLPEATCANRDELIQAIVRYKKRKAHEIVLVFDGTHGGQGDYGHANTGSVKVVYTPLTVQADDYIEELLDREGGQNVLVVSSDRRIQRAARKAKAFWAYSKEFAQRLRWSSGLSEEEETPPWMEGREEVYEVPKKGTKKRGSSYRNTQEERRRLKKLEAL